MHIISNDFVAHIFKSVCLCFNLGVKTTHHRGHTPEEVAEMATEKIISVSDTAPPQITY